MHFPPAEVFGLIEKFPRSSIAMHCIEEVLEQRVLDGKTKYSKAVPSGEVSATFLWCALLWSCSVLWDEAETCHVFRNLMLTSRDEIFGTHPHFVSCAQF